MKKAIQVVSTFIVVIFISTSFILWPQIECYLFGEEDEYTIVKNTDLSNSFIQYTDSISIFSEENWNKVRYKDLIEDIEIHKDQGLVSNDEFRTLKKNIRDAYTNTLRNSIKNWTLNKCIDDSIKVIKEEIFGISDTNLTYKGYLEEEIDILNTYNEITKNFINKINKTINFKFDTVMVEKHKNLISQYKRDKNFKKCSKVIGIVKDAENIIQKYEIHIKEYNDNIDYYIENLINELVCSEEHYERHGTTCAEHILEYGIYSHNTWKNPSGQQIQDPDQPWKFDYSSDGEPLICYDFKDYKFYSNELKTKKICND